MMKRILAISLVSFAVLLAALASAQSPGIAFNKDGTLLGTGSSGSALGVNTSTIQKRITPGCASGSAIRTVGSDGSVVCETVGSGDITGVTVTSPACSAGSFMTTLTGGASSGDAPVGGTCAWSGLLFSIGQEGVFPTNTSGSKIDNWSPTDLATKPVLQVQAGDDHGTLITGIDAIGSGLAVGTTRIVCNTNAPQDDGVIAFSAEGSTSAPNNRIWTPGYGRNSAQTAVDRKLIGPSECATLVYIQPDQSDPTVNRWVFADSNGRQGATQIAQLGIFPASYPAAISGTVNNWDPDDACAGVAGPLNTSTCEAGLNIASASRSLIMISTTSSTAVTITGLKYNNSQYADGNGPVKILVNMGPGNVTLATTTGSLANNQFQIGSGANTYDIVLPPNGSAIFWHQRDTGGWIPIGHQDSVFDRSATFRQGLTAVAGSSSYAIDSTISTTGRTAGAYLAHLLDSGSTNTTGGAITNTGLASVMGATRSAGASSVTNIAGIFQASGGQTNYAWQSVGDEYHGLGSQSSFVFVNTLDADFAAAAEVETTFSVGGGAFTSTTRKQIAKQSTAPTVNHGTLAADSGNFVGEITGIGAFTSVTLTFGASGYGTSSHCIAQAEGATAFAITVSTVSKTAPVFSCFDMAGTAANCPDFNYQCWGH